MVITYLGAVEIIYTYYIHILSNAYLNTVESMYLDESIN